MCVCVCVCTYTSYSSELYKAPEEPCHDQNRMISIVTSCNLNDVYQTLKNNEGQIPRNRHELT